MEIKSIKKIENIGRFIECSGADFRFEKLTFIYGLNTLGKTTLVDIFQSLKDNDSNRIFLRKTIPNKQSKQKIIFSIKENEKPSEKDLQFKNEGWEQNELSKYLEVFGHDFIHKNLFTGLSIERENKENFTQFVLGEEGVKIVYEIESNKKTLNEKNRDKDKKLPLFIRGKDNQEIKEFLEFDITNLNKITIEKELLQKQDEKQKEEKRRQEPQKIIDLKDVVPITIPEENILKNLSKINEYLQKDYTEIREEFLKRFKEHIQQNSIHLDNAEIWIREGFQNTKDKNGNCIFCGQSLKNVADIIELYEKYFDENYSKHISEIETKIRNLLNNIEDISFNLKSYIQEQLTTSLEYKNIISGDKFKNLLEVFSEKLQKIDENFLEEEKKKLIILIKEKQQQKERQPYSKIDGVNFNEFKEIFEEYLSALTEIKTTIESIKTQIKNFKNSCSDTSTISNNISNISKKIEELKYQKARIEQNNDCSKYQKELQNIQDLKNNIEEDREELENNQNQYLNRYFKKINELFKKFGSHDFSLERKEEKKGHQPVYALKVKFHHQEITNEQIKSVFSESDRRALALAVFWAKIELKNNEDKQKTVVILDDPVTSFDDNRITNSMDLLKSSLDQLSQIIILTHYPNFVKIFCEKTKEKTIKTKFLKIKSKENGSELAMEKRETFTESDYEKLFNKIWGFIENRHSNCIKADLRPFLESLYLPTVFAKQLENAKNSNKDISNLERMIDVIFTKEEVKKKFHYFRQCMNPDSHKFTANNEEDVKNFAREMMDYLYSFEFPDKP